MGRLNSGDLREFGQAGYLIVPNVVSEDSLRAAEEEVDQLLKTVPPDEGSGGPGANLWFRPRAELPNCDAVLRGSGALDIANELVAPLEVDHAFDHIQVATTVPPWSYEPGGPHIDGHDPNRDSPATFTLLAGILLSDQSAPGSGNLWVWPGSHLDHQRLFTERGTRVLQQSSGHSTLLDPPLDLGPSVEVREAAATSCSRITSRDTTKGVIRTLMYERPSISAWRCRHTRNDGSKRFSIRSSSSLRFGMSSAASPRRMGD